MNPVLISQEESPILPPRNLWGKPGRLPLPAACWGCGHGLPHHLLETHTHTHTRKPAHGGHDMECEVALSEKPTVRTISSRGPFLSALWSAAGPGPRSPAHQERPCSTWQAVHMLGEQRELGETAPLPTCCEGHWSSHSRPGRQINTTSRGCQDTRKSLNLGWTLSSVPPVHGPEESRGFLEVGERPRLPSPPLS